MNLIVDGNNMKTVLGIFPLLKRLNKASQEDVPLEMIRDLSGLFSPEQINEICFQYKVWSFLSELNDCCEGCGDYLPIGSKSTTGTCSNRCHQLVKRAAEKDEISPIQTIRKEASERLQHINSLWEKSKQYGYKKDYAWHQVSDGWKVVSIL